MSTKLVKRYQARKGYKGDGGRSVPRKQGAADGLARRNAGQIYHSNRT